MRFANWKMNLKRSHDQNSERRFVQIKLLQLIYMLGTGTLTDLLLRQLNSMHCTRSGDVITMEGLWRSVKMAHVENKCSVSVCLTPVAGLLLLKVSPLSDADNTRLVSLSCLFETEKIEIQR